MDFGSSNPSELGLLTACSSGASLEVVRHYVEEQGLSVNAHDGLGRTPLHFASARGDAKLVEYLLRVGANPNAVDNQGTMPLHLAASVNHSIVVGLLASAGADPRAPDARGRSALDWARSRLAMVKSWLDEHRSGNLLQLSTPERREKLRAIITEIESVEALLKAHLSRPAGAGDPSRSNSNYNPSNEEALSTIQELDDLNKLLSSMAL